MDGSFTRVISILVAMGFAPNMWGSPLLPLCHQFSELIAEILATIGSGYKSIIAIKLWGISLNGSFTRVISILVAIGFAPALSGSPFCHRVIDIWSCEFKLHKLLVHVQVHSHWKLWRFPWIVLSPESFQFLLPRVLHQTWENHLCCHFVINFWSW